MLRPFDEQPIAALASGSGPGAVGVIRASGAQVWGVLNPLFKPSSLSLAPRQAQLKQIIDPSNLEIVDEVVTVFFQGPRSFTGQDTLEIYCHGGPYVIQRILTLIFAAGVRPAQPGEFTKRALLNGKLDLTAAEGIRTLVEAQSRQQWVSGRQLYQGKLRQQIEQLRQEIVGALAYLEAMIDFPDEGDTQKVQLQEVYARVDTVLHLIVELRSTFDSGKVASRGLAVALAGAPNAGKSTLLNELLGKKRAIVSDIAGTTRDYIEEPCLIDGRFFRLFDTAGMRETIDLIEQQGVALSRQIVSEADVILVLEASDSAPHEREVLDALISEIQKPVIRVMTKSDIRKPEWGKNLLHLSCKSGEGLSSLKSKLVSLVDQATGKLEDRPFITSSRQAQALDGAEIALKKFQASYNTFAGHEMLAFELQDAARSLSSIVGDISSEDVLDKIFRDFCVGK